MPPKWSKSDVRIVYYHTFCNKRYILWGGSGHLKRKQFYFSHVVTKVELCGDSGNETLCGFDTVYSKLR